ncbi:titin homolog isoform X3 [Tribolium castaneum]|uniref:titin homolog isoform X3 n=1 Tax=Tribolium castaneum TaxID=7070 RepID=UPI0030FE6289
MSSAAVGTHHHHSGAGPLSLMSCVRESSPLQDFEPPDTEKNAATKKKFWNPKKWFKRKNKPAEDASVEVIVDKDVLRSRSTSELSITEEQTRRRSGSSMHPGLSVSHDSVFHSPNSGSDIELDAAQSSSSLSISQPQIDLRLQTELSERLRLRRGRGDTSEDDEGLPHSPCNSPTTTEALLDKTAIKDLPTKSHSTCSDGSLLSMGSSEMDEESFSQQSRHSSKLSLQEKRSSDQDSDLELGASPSAPLNHSAAHHRVAVRPKRRAPHRNKRVPQLSNALPTTPEVNEEISIRSMTPESVSRAPPDADSSKLNRSRSNAGSKSEDHFATLEEDVEREEKTDKSFFDRIFPRRSAKKRKSKEEKTVTVQSSYSKRVESKPIAAPRSGAAARQRIQPIDLPPSPEVQKREPDSGPPEKSVAGTSPLQAELESRFKQRQTLNASLTPPQSPNIDSSSSVITQVEMKTRNEETKTKIKMPGLSSLQQRVLSLNDEVDDAGFKSLTDLPDKPAKPVTKSHSFKAAKPEKTEKFVVTEATNERKISVTKAASLDSVKHLEEPQYTSEVTQEFTVVKNESRIKESDSTFSDFNSDVTVSGPSHTAVVNVNYNLANTITSAEKIKEVTTKECVSVTKIHLKRESTQVTQSTVTVPKNAVPEFLNRQLNKVEAKPSNVVFSMNSPRIIDEQTRPKSVEPDKVAKNIPRKFSQEDIEIIEKSEEAPKVATPRFRKNESNKRKSSTSSTTSSESPPVGEKPILRSRSISLDSLKGETESLDKSSQDSLDKEKTGSVVETVVLRKKSLIKQRNDEEPELMKVFARRSLKLKDSESEAVSQQVSVMLDDSKTRDSDKENQAESPQEERKKSVNESNEAPEIREPLTETIKTPTKEQPKIKEKCIELTEVTLRKPGNNFYTRAFSMNAKSGETDEMKVKKQASFSERRITENWITNIKNGDDLIERKISQDEIITGISPKSDFITEEVLTERKNFNQRKAEWEKRAQEAQKKSVP